MSDTNPDRYRDAETGAFVSEEYAREHPATTVSEKDWRRSQLGKLVSRLHKEGGVLVSTKNCTPEGIESARAEKRIVEDEDGDGFVWIQYERQWR